MNGPNLFRGPAWMNHVFVSLRLLQKNLVDDLTQCTVYIVRCTVNHETEERREKKKRDGYRILKNQNNSF